MLSARLLLHHLDSAHFANPPRLTLQLSSHLPAPPLHPSVHPRWECLPGAEPHGQIQKEQHCNCTCWKKKLLNWPVWLNEEGQFCPPFSTHDLPCLPSPSLPRCTPVPRPSQALPGRRTQPHVRHLTLTHYPSPFFLLCQNPPPHPPIGFHGKLSFFVVVVPEAASQHSHSPLNHTKRR